MWGPGKRGIESMDRKRQLVDRCPRFKGGVSHKARAGREPLRAQPRSSSPGRGARSLGAVDSKNRHSDLSGYMGT